jgi:hypothetical protein
VCVIYNIIWKHMIQAAKQLAQSAIDQSDQAQQMIVNNGNQPIITLCSSLCEVLYYGSWPFCRAQGSCWTDDWTSHCLGIPNDSKGCMLSESSYAFQHFLLLFTTFYRVTNFNNEGRKRAQPLCSCRCQRCLDEPVVVSPRFLAPNVERDGHGWLMHGW